MTNNLKKVISSAAVVAMVASSASAFAVTFPDVDATANYAGAVQTLSALNIVQGDDNGLFNPDNNVTRGEFTKMVVEALGEGSVAEATTTSQFTDAATTTQHWAAGYIATGVSEGWINGYGDGTFGPDDSVTYVQAVKMLVSAIGYESYAQNQGGWPSGYLQFGNSLHIIDGVSATSNDAELTRAQCAMLVANALEAPVVEYGDMTYGGILGNIPVQNLQQMNGTGEGWQTLLTRKHDAYVVRGRVEATSRTNTGLDSDQVKFKVETAENFDGIYYGSNGSAPTSVDVYINDTDAANMLFEYAEAIIQKDEDTDEYKFISITQYGASRTEEIDADLYESYVETKDSSNTITARTLNMYRTESSSSTTAYRLEKDAELYVNGVSLGVITPELAEKYLNTDNAVGNITLVDETEQGSTATNGYYDYITVDYYVDAVVDSISASDSQVRVYFKIADQAVNRARLEWDPQDEDVTVTFTKDDAAITYEDLAEYDVVSIAYDVSRGDFQGSSFYDVIVAQNSVTGSISSKNTDDNLIVIDGSDYEMSAIASLSDFEFNTEYTIYVDAFGKVAYFEEGAASKTIGVVVAMYKSAGTTNPTVRLITADGTEATYETKEKDDADAFYQVATGKYGEKDAPVWNYDNDPEVTKDEVLASGIQNMVVTYRISSGKIVFTGHEAGTRGGPGQDYRASSVKLGNYTLDETATSLLDMSSYILDDDVVSVTTTASLVDEAEYTAYFYDRSNSTGAYRFVLITEGTNSITPDTHVAVVTGAVSQVSNDNGDYISIPVVTATTTSDAENPDSQSILYEGDAKFNEGDVIIYSTKSDGTVSTLYNVISMANGNTSYETLRDNVFKNDTFTSFVNPGVVNATTNEWFKTSDQKPAEAYFGPIYRKTTNSVELILSQSEETVDGVAYKVTDLNDSNAVTDFSVAGDNVASYVVDYSERTGKARRVYNGTLNTSTTSMYSVANVTTDDYDYILWSTTNADNADNTVMGEDIRPNFAFIKTVDGDVTDVVYFVAD